METEGPPMARFIGILDACIHTSKSGPSLKGIAVSAMLALLGVVLMLCWR
jgi:hypothetical protein